MCDNGVESWPGDLYDDGSALNDNNVDIGVIIST